MISVLVPVYNSAKYLRKCLNSILKQTYTDFELVILNDGSKDESGDIIKEFAEKDSRVKSFYKENEKSISKTRNRLLEYINGEYFIFVDSDDVVDKRFLELLYKTMVDTQSDIVSCEFKINNRQTPNKKGRGAKSVNSQKALQTMIFGGKFYAVWNKLIKTEIAKGIRFDEDLNYGEDMVFFFDLLKQDTKFTFINNKLYYYRIRQNSLSTNKFGDSKKKFLERLIEMSNNDEYEKIKEILMVWIYCTAKYFRYLTRHSKKENLEYRLYLKDIIRDCKVYYQNSKDVTSTYKLVISFFSMF